MALSDEQIAEITFSVYGSAMHQSDYEYARAIEAAVRKDYDALLRQLVEALTACRANGAIEGFVFDTATGAIKAARARLEQPCA